MSRSVLTVVLAAAISSSAALGFGVEVMAEADDSPQAVVAPAPTKIPLGKATPGLQPRSVVPDRPLEVEAAPVLRATRYAGVGPLLAAPGRSRDPVDRGGPVVRFSVEVEQDSGLTPSATAALVEEALYDARSWARSHDLRRVEPADATIHVIIASPASTDAICAKAGLRTLGRLSCWSGRTAAINLDRWQSGVPHVPDLAQYRRYLVNHEVGHGLGHGHRGCPGRGRTAPLMQQQTKGLDGCVANEWAYPDG